MRERYGRPLALPGRWQGRSLTLYLSQNIAKGPKFYKSICDGPNMIRTYVLAAAAQLIELGERRRVESVAHVAPGAIRVRGRDELGEEDTRREQPHGCAGRAPRSEEHTSELQSQF